MVARQTPKKNAPPPAQSVEFEIIPGEPIDVTALLDGTAPNIIPPEPKGKKTKMTQAQKQEQSMSVPKNPAQSDDPGPSVRATTKDIGRPDNALLEGRLLVAGNQYLTLVEVTMLESMKILPVYHPEGRDPRSVADIEYQWAEMLEEYPDLMPKIVLVSGLPGDEDNTRADTLDTELLQAEWVTCGFRWNTYRGKPLLREFFTFYGIPVDGMSTMNTMPCQLTPAEQNALMAEEEEETGESLTPPKATPAPAVKRPKNTPIIAQVRTVPEVADDDGIPDSDPDIMDPDVP